MANNVLEFPSTMEEFLEEQQIVDSEQIYTNGLNLVIAEDVKLAWEHFKTNIIKDFLNEITYQNYDGASEEADLMTLVGLAYLAGLKNGRAELALWLTKDEATIEKYSNDDLPEHKWFCAEDILNSYLLEENNENK